MFVAGQVWKKRLPEGYKGALFALSNITYNKVYKTSVKGFHGSRQSLKTVSHNGKTFLEIWAGEICDFIKAFDTFSLNWKILGFSLQWLKLVYVLYTYIGRSIYIFLE